MELQDGGQIQAAAYDGINQKFVLITKKSFFMFDDISYDLKEHFIGDFDSENYREIEIIYPKTEQQKLFIKALYLIKQQALIFNDDK